MRIKTLTVCGVGGIDELKIELDPSMNIICGANGVGKTTLVECIAHTFSRGSTNILRRHAEHEKGIITVDLVDAGEESGSRSFELTQFDPTQQERVGALNIELSKYLMSVKSLRTIQYRNLSAVQKDSDRQANRTSGAAIQGIALEEIKQWFVNRFLYSGHKGILEEHQIANFELAKRSFGLLDATFKFERIDVSNEILVSTPTGVIYYEYLSAGFKSCVALVVGIIMEIELRFTSPRIQASSFDGIVVIDELELHLHPQWQTVIGGVLCELFPKVQFITTTHSPHVVQRALRHQIVALENQDGRTRRRDLPETKYGFQGWTIEEILTDVMGLTDTRSALLNENLTRFQQAIDDNDESTAREVFDLLDSILHPNNHVRKLLQIQLGGVGGRADD